MEGRDPVAFFPDGSTVRYHLDTGAVTRHARGKTSELTQNVQAEQNILRLASAQQTFLRTHPGQTARYKDLVGPGKPLPQFAISVDESYPAVYPPGGDIVATLRDGKILKRSIRPDVFRLIREDPKNPEVDAPEVPITPAAGPFEKLSPPAQSEEITKYLKAGPATALAGLLAAKKIERSPLKVRQLQTLLGGFLAGRRVTDAFAQSLIAKVKDPATDPEERELLLGTCQQALGDPWFDSVLIQAVPRCENPAVREAFIRMLTNPDVRGDCTTQVWCESNDADLLARSARAIIKRSRTIELELVLSSALSPDTAPEIPEAALHKTVARYALPEIRSEYATEALAAQLAKTKPDTDDARILGTLLYRIGTEAAAQSLGPWLQAVTIDLQPYLKNLGARRPKSPEMQAMAAAVTAPANPFANEANRASLRAFIAPPVVLYALKNGSFEDGTLSAFTTTGEVSVCPRFASFLPTERKFMAVLQTTEDPRDGLSTLTSDPVVVPAGVHALHFDYRFAGSVLFHPLPEMLEIHVLAAGEDTRIENLLPTGKLQHDQSLSGYDHGFGFRTGSIPVDRWAGQPIQVKFVLRGRGKIPEFIPGMNRDDHNPMGGNQPGTLLAVDNLRFSTAAEPPVLFAYRDVAIESDRKTVTVRTRANALPPGAQLLIRDFGSGKEIAIDQDTHRQVVYTIPCGDDRVWDTFYVACATDGLDGNGQFISPELTLAIRRD